MKNNTDVMMYIDDESLGLEEANLLDICEWHVRNEMPVYELFKEENFMLVKKLHVQLHRIAIRLLELKK